MTDRRVTVVTDLGYGDAGKGSIVDYLAQSEAASVVVRFNGGAQAGHNVVTADGRHHTFSQFGSGSFVPGVKTHLSRFMLASPLYLMQEAEKLFELGVTDALARMTIDEQTLVISPFQQSANRLREMARGDGRHGSCGFGVGETMADSLDHPDYILVAGDLHRPAIARRKLTQLRDYKLASLEDVIKNCGQNPAARRELETFHDPELIDAVMDFYAEFAGLVRIVDGNYLAELLRDHEHVAFEGAQGVLLDEWRGFHPYTTWSTTTNANADTLLDESGYDGKITRLGLLRGYATRHGAGPFVTEDAGLTQQLGDPYNPENPWQGNFRVGHFDAVAARYALEVTGNVDGLVITNLDRMAGQPNWQICEAYDYGGTNRPEAFGSDRAERIIPSPPMDLDYQERLTQGLFETKPVMQSAQTTDRNAYLELIEAALKVPVVLTSDGPTAQDKRRHQAAMSPAL